MFDKFIKFLLLQKKSQNCTFFMGDWGWQKSSYVDFFYFICKFWHVYHQFKVTSFHKLSWNQFQHCWQESHTDVFTRKEAPWRFTFHAKLARHECLRTFHRHPSLSNSRCPPHVASVRTPHWGHTGLIHAELVRAVYLWTNVDTILSQPVWCFG